MYLLDTNICSRVLEGDVLIDQKLATVSQTVEVYLCTIVQGELFYMALKSDRKATNLARVNNFCRPLKIYSVEEKTAEIYGELKAKIIDTLGPKEKAKRRRVRVIDLGFSDNDLWIAVAIQHNLTLVSSDSDFGRLAMIGSFGVETW